MLSFGYCDQIVESQSQVLISITENSFIAIKTSDIVIGLLKSLIFIAKSNK